MPYIKHFSFYLVKQYLLNNTHVPGTVLISCLTQDCSFSLSNFHLTFTSLHLSLNGTFSGKASVLVHILQEVNAKIGLNKQEIKWKRVLWKIKGEEIRVTRKSLRFQWKCEGEVGGRRIR